MFDPTDAVTARDLLEAHLALTSKPTLDSETIDILFAQAASVDGDDTVYLVADLNRAVSSGWTIKAGLTADQYDITGQGGAKLTRDQWFQHCLRMAEAYGSGLFSVTGTSIGRGGLTSIGITTSTSATYWDTYA